MLAGNDVPETYGPGNKRKINPSAALTLSFVLISSSPH